LLADLWLIHDVRSAKLDQLFHIVLDQLSRSAQLSRLNIPAIATFSSCLILQCYKLFTTNTTTTTTTTTNTKMQHKIPLTL